MSEPVASDHSSAAVTNDVVPMAVSSSSSDTTTHTTEPSANFSALAKQEAGIDQTASSAVLSNEAASTAAGSSMKLETVQNSMSAVTPELSTNSEQKASVKLEDVQVSPPEETVQKLAAAHPTSETSMDFGVVDKEESSDDDSSDDEAGDTLMLTGDLEKDRMSLAAAMLKNAATEFDEGLDEDEPEIKEPPRTKNEIVGPLQALTSTITVAPEYTLEHVGRVMSVVENTIVVEGGTNSRAVDIGSVFALPTRQPIGKVDDTFGPVKEPYYVIKLQHDDPILKEVEEDLEVCLVKELSTFALPITAPGSDASNPNDEEIPLEDQEFSDDEAEAAAKMAKKKEKKMQKRRQQNDFAAIENGETGPIPDTAVDEEDNEVEGALFSTSRGRGSRGRGRGSGRGRGGNINRGRGGRGGRGGSGPQHHSGSQQPQPQFPNFSFGPSPMANMANMNTPFGYPSQTPMMMGQGQHAMSHPQSGGYFPPQGYQGFPGSSFGNQQPFGQPQQPMQMQMNNYAPQPTSFQYLVPSAPQPSAATPFQYIQGMGMPQQPR